MKIGRLIITNNSEKLDNSKILTYDIFNKKIYNISKEIISDVINKKISNRTKLLNEKLENDNQKILNLEKEIKFYDEKLNLVRILVTNSCNLKCKYCYACDGTYGQKKSNMTIETAEKTFNYLISNYKSIREINFFGGEPMLNIEIIEYICKKITHEYKKLHKTIPMFSIITNGTILNDYILEVINKYNITVIVSLDFADSKINDENRIYFNNKGTFNTIDKNIKKIIDKTNLLFAIEATYNDEHIKNNISYIDIMKKNFSRYGIKLNIITPISNKKNLSENNQELIEKNSFKSQLKFFIETGVINQNLLVFLKSIFSYSYSKYYCDALIGQISISPQGDIYPCQMFIAQNMNASLKKFCIGNVKNNVNKKEEVLKWFENNNNKNLNSCGNCNVKNVCGECAFYNYIENNFNINCNDKIINYYKQINDFLDIISEKNNSLKFEKNLNELSKKTIVFSKNNIT